MVGFFAWLGIMELWSKLESGMTLSQQFYVLPDGIAWTITVFWFFGWSFGLLVHLNWKRISKWFDKKESS